MWERNVNLGTSCTCPNQGPNPQPRHVPCLRIKLGTFSFAGWHLSNWATPVRAVQVLYSSQYPLKWFLDFTPLNPWTKELTWKKPVSPLAYQTNETEESTWELTFHATSHPPACTPLPTAQKTTSVLVWGRGSRAQETWNGRESEDCCLNTPKKRQSLRCLPALKFCGSMNPCSGRHLLLHLPQSLASWLS